MPAKPTYYIFHMKCEKNEETGEFLFSFTCKGGCYHFDCHDDKGEFFIECTTTQKCLLLNQKRRFFKINKPAEWFFHRFGVSVKPFYNRTQIGFSERKLEEFRKVIGTQKIYFEKQSDGLFRYTHSMEPTPHWASVAYQELCDFDSDYNNRVIGHIFDYAYTAFWWKEYYGFYIYDQTPKTQKKRGPRGELANLIDSSIYEKKYPKKARTE